MDTTITKISLLLNIFAFLIILRKLYIVRHHGKIIINQIKVAFQLYFGVG